MVAHWLLLLLMLPGWLVPSGLRMPLCGCRVSLAETRACCAPFEEPVERASCCASAREDEAPSDAPTAREDDERACRCSVAVPTHEGGQSFAPGAHYELAPPILATTTFEALVAPCRAALRADRERPRGPSPGGPIPLPLRL